MSDTQTPPHLLLIALGPVQEFIAQARRTRDLWFGSHLLSEIGRATAKALAEAGATLIFPALAKGDPEFEPCDHPTRKDGHPPVNIANKILAELPAGVEPRKHAELAHAAALCRWRNAASDVFDEWKSKGALAPNSDEAWDEQINSLIEFVATWAPLTGGYTATLELVESELAARKHLRDFDPWTAKVPGAYKSSLDGGRDSVLLPSSSARRERGLYARARIARGEQLDAIGLVKRAGGTPDQFVPIDRVAFAAWLDAAQDAAPDAIENLRAACAEFGIQRVNRRDLAWVERFPFDASFLQESRWPSLAEEQGRDAAEGVEWGRRSIRPILRRLRPLIGEPHPYVACLVADGDRMGAALKELVSADEHRKFSRKLSSFAARAREIVEHEHRGMLIYAGGDDVLAFVCVTDVLDCAKKLAQSFESVMGDAIKGTKISSNELPTLSVGIGIGHVMDGMGELLDLGRRAEKLAKGTEQVPLAKQRNALAIVVDKRSGGTVQWRAQWSCDPVEQMQGDIEALANGQISTKKVYEIRADLRRMPAVADMETLSPTERELWARLIVRDIARTLSRSQLGLGDADDSGASALAIGPELDAQSQNYAEILRAADEWAIRLLIAKTFARHRLRAAATTGA